MNLFPQSDISRAAQSMIREYGKKAADRAIAEALKAASQQRRVARVEWENIVREIKRLQDEPEAGC